jgi:hypothetical protein
LSKDYDRKTLEVAVRQVLQEDWALRRATAYHKAPSPTLKETVRLRQKNILMLGAVLKKLEIGEIGTPFSLSFDLQLRLSEYRIPLQELNFGRAVLQVGSLAHSTETLDW